MNTFVNALVNVLAIIGIIVAGGFVVFFLGDLLLSILDPKKSKKKEGKQEETRPVVEKEQSKEVRPIIVEAQPKEVKTLDEEEVKEVDDAKAFEEAKLLTQAEEPEADEFDEIRKAEEEFRQRNLHDIEERRKASKEAKASQPEEEEIDLNDIFFDEEDFDFGKFEDEPEAEEAAEKPEELDGQVSIFDQNIEPIQEEPKEEVEGEPETEKEVVTEQTIEETIEYPASASAEASNEELEELKKQLEEQKAEYEELLKKSEEEKNKLLEEKAELTKLFEQAEKDAVEATVQTPNLSLKEYEDRLEVLKERLKVALKDYKANKKEFNPLMKVRKTLDADKRKLRRREALVAKQKVELYGVNNYVDIDEEKAKKLAEDLDLLDGLRLSVQHCEEVIEANKERYPILETTNRILKTQVNDLKADIAECEKSIEELNAKAGADATDADDADLGAITDVTFVDITSPEEPAQEETQAEPATEEPAVVETTVEETTQTEETIEQPNTETQETGTEE